MYSYRLASIVTLVLVLACAHSQMTDGQSSEFYPFEHKRQDSAHKYCGKHLSNALQLLCNGVYNSMFKKSGQEKISEMDMDDDYLYNYDYPFRSRASANAMMGRFGGGRFRRQSRGIHDECCVKPCSISELMSYCG